MIKKKFAGQRVTGRMLADKARRPDLFSPGFSSLAAFELDDADGDAVQVKDDVGTPLVAAAQGHFLGQGEVVVLRVLPIHQMHLFVRLSGGNLHRHAVAQQLVGAQVGLIERDAGGVSSGHQLLQGGGNVRLRIAARLQVVAEQVRFDATVVLPFVPLTEVAVAQAIGPGLVREQGDDAVLRLAFGAGISGMAASCGDKPRSSGEQFLHHGLLEGAGLLSPLLQRRQLRVHVRQHLGDGGLFGEGRKRNLYLLCP